MTFEDFKKQFEIFTKTDSAEKLAFCENQYQKHLLLLEDANYFEPLENNLEHNLISLYEKNLNTIFGLDCISENQISFLAKPSFEPEHLLCLEKKQDKFILRLTLLTKNYWAVFYTDNTIINVGKKVLTAELNVANGSKLFSMLDNVISEARKPKTKGIILDGVVYCVIKMSGGKQKAVFKHSPGKGSKSGMVIDIMEKLINNFGTLDDTLLLNIETEINNILK